MMSFNAWEKKLSKKTKPGAVICKSREEAIAFLTFLRDRCYRWEAGTVILPDLHIPEHNYPMKYVVYPWTGIVQAYSEDLYPIVADQVISEMELEQFLEFAPEQEDPELGSATAEADPVEEITKEELLREIFDNYLQTAEDRYELYMLLRIYGEKPVLKELESNILKRRAKAVKEEKTPEVREKTPAKKAMTVVVPMPVSPFFW